MNELEEEFERAIHQENVRSKPLGYNPTRYRQMIDQYGGLNTAKRLLSKHEITQGLIDLYELDCLDESMEALVIQERFKPLFTESEIEEAY